MAKRKRTVEQLQAVRDSHYRSVARASRKFADELLERIEEMKRQNVATTDLRELPALVASYPIPPRGRLGSVSYALCLVCLCQKLRRPSSANTRAVLSFLTNLLPKVGLCAAVVRVHRFAHYRRAVGH